MLSEVSQTRLLGNNRGRLPSARKGPESVTSPFRNVSSHPATLLNVWIETQMILSILLPCRIPHWASSHSEGDGVSSSLLTRLMSSSIF